LIQYFDITRKKKSDDFVDKNINLNTKKSRNFLVYYVIVFILVIVLIFSLFKLIFHSNNSGSSDQSSTNNTKTTQPKVAAATNSTEANINLPNPTKIDSNTTESNFSSNSNDLSKTKIIIKILNGSGKSNIASQTQDVLEKAGFSVSETGTAKSVYNKSIIYYAADKEESAKLVADSLKDYEISLEYDNDIVGEFDLLVVIGKK